jgi:hypothetical protein
MSDYNNPKDFDKYGNPVPPLTTPYEPAGETSGRAPYVLLGILVLIGIVGGALYFNGGQHTDRPDVASAPPAMSDTATPTPSHAPTGAVNTTPAPTATPAPAGPPATTTTQQ